MNLQAQTAGFLLPSPLLGVRFSLFFFVPTLTCTNDNADTQNIFHFRRQMVTNNVTVCYDSTNVHNSKGI